MTPIRLFPSPSGAEQAVVGSLLAWPTDVPGVVPKLASKDFSNRDYGRIFAAIADAHAEGLPITPFVISALLFERGQAALRDMLLGALDAATIHLDAAVDAILENRRRVVLRMAIDDLERDTRAPWLTPAEVADRMALAAADAHSTANGEPERDDFQLICQALGERSGLDTERIAIALDRRARRIAEHVVVEAIAVAAEGGDA